MSLELICVALASGVGAFIGATGGRMALFIVRTAVRLGWNGLWRVFGRR